MTSIDITNLSQFRHLAKELQRATNKTIKEFVAWRAAIVCHDIIDFLPPRGKSPASEGWNKQKERGYKNVDRDVRKIFKNGADLFDILKLHPLVQSHPKLAAILIRYIEAKDYANLSRVLYKIGSRVVLIPQPLREQHFSQRNATTGRVFRKPSSRYYVLSDQKIQGYVTGVQRDVGKLKAGCMPAAKKLGVKDIPLWVRRHSGDGKYVDELDHIGIPSFTIINQAQGIERFATVVQDAVNLQGHKMEIELEKKLGKTFAEHGATA